MVTGIVIPSETHSALQKEEFETLADYQSAVGGYIETIHLADHPVTIIADEEGKVKRLPINKRATLFWWLLNPQIIDGDLLVGDVIVVGPVEDGELTDIPEELRKLLLETFRYQVVACLSRQFDNWVPIGESVDDFFEAARRALSLMAVWSPPNNVKVVAAD